MGYLDGAQSREAYNEKVKLLSQTAQNLGVAMTVAVIGTLLTAGFSPLLAYGALVAIFLFATAYKVLGNLEGEPT